MDTVFLKHACIVHFHYKCGRISLMCGVNKLMMNGKTQPMKCDWGD